MSRPSRRALLAAAAGLLVAGGRTLAAATSRLTLLTHNVYYGFTRTDPGVRARWREWMAGLAPDVVSLQELVGFTPATLAADAAAWGHAHTALLKEDGFPVGLTARRPLEDVVRLQDGFRHGAVRARVDGIVVYAVHLHPSDWHRRILEGQALLRDVASLGPDARVVLAGDFNGFAPADRAAYEASPELIPFFEGLDRRDSRAQNLNAGRLDYRGVELLVEAGLIDAQARRRGPTDFTGTFPTPLVAAEDHGPDRRLDYVFLSANLADGLVDCRVLRDDETAKFSDHFPVLAELDLPPAS